MAHDRDNRTDRLIRDARELRTRAQRAADDLQRTTAEVRESVAFARWWRFLGYDTNVTEFLQNLDHDESRKSVEH